LAETLMYLKMGTGSGVSSDHELLWGFEVHSRPMELLSVEWCSCSEGSLISLSLLGALCSTLPAPELSGNGQQSWKVSESLLGHEHRESLCAMGLGMLQFSHLESEKIVLGAI
jgi:hypothetical protein